MLLSKRLVPVLIAFILFGLTIFFTGQIAQFVSGYFWLKPGVIETVGLQHPQEVLLGDIFQRKAMEVSDVLPMYGSSELGSGYDSNPTKVFANRPTGFTPFIIARGSCQTLVHILNIASQKNIQGKKIVVSFSPDWFGNPKGIPDDKFAMNSSPLKIYDILFNSDLSSGLKAQIIKRILELPKIAEDDYVLKQYLNTYKNSGSESQVNHALFWPLARMEYAALQIQDALNVKKITSKLDPKVVSTLAKVRQNQPADWGKIQLKATSQAQQKMKNNLNISEDLYAQNVKPGTKNSQNGTKTLNPSIEYNDLKLMLDLLHEKNVKPLFVMIPYNGLFRDYTGLPKEVRMTYYQKILTIIRESGFQVVDLSPHEKELYYMQDPYHLGWKGWAQLDEIIDGFYKSPH